MESAEEKALWNKKGEERELRPFCLANDAIFRTAALDYPEIIIQTIVDALFPNAGHRIDGTNYETTFVGNEFLPGVAVDSLAIDKSKRTLFDIEMQLYPLEINRTQHYFNAIRQRADSPIGFEVPIDKIYIIFFCDRDPLGRGQAIYNEMIGCCQTKTFRDAGFEFILVDMTSQKQGLLADVCHDLLCRDLDYIKNPNFKELLFHYRRNHKEIR